MLKPALAGQVLPDEGERRAIADHLHVLVVARLAACWSEDKVPRELAKGALSVNSLQNRLRAIAKLPGGEPDPSAAKFAEWRKQHEALLAAAGSPNRKRKAPAPAPAPEAAPEPAPEAAPEPAPAPAPTPEPDPAPAPAPAPEQQSTKSKRKRPAKSSPVTPASLPAAAPAQSERMHISPADFFAQQ